ncbi:Glycosyltransferase involved in cell wall bisynthesis [Marinobacter sp. LV10R510-11A]|uniref:glycosyltransferase family 2 protein n=1 Tax=Marinobacter sp. LV10R510-11A TaxID=1415568 RepID=UPI000BB7018E|nr:glycosyltransferase family 2 protein [Marinobacter sp. LV10R510-11A]SOB74545.1 Glycosyltransferase involved in cell wall bisynthesis [Marinobacter sp. LV10R510-11A]
MKFKYSIIIPHYNSEVSLNILLSSIPNDDLLEVLVIDDRSSTAEYRQVIESSSLANIKEFSNKGVKGAGSCRNIGVEKATGQYLIFADSDDYFTTNAFENINAAVDEIDEQIDILFFQVTSSDSRNKLGFRHIKNSVLVTNYINKTGKYYKEKIRLTHNVPWGKVFRAEFVRNNNIKFDETIIANDGMFSLKAGKLSKDIACSNKEIYCVTQSENSLTTTKNVNHYRVRLEVYTRYYNYLSRKERKHIEASPFPLLYLSFDYGVVEVVRSIIYLKKNRVSIFKNFKFSFERLKRFTSRLSK